MGKNSEQKTYIQGLKFAALSFWRKYRASASFITFVSAVLGIAAGYFTFVDWRVRLIVKDPEFVDAVAKRIRPVMVFDSDQRILSDTGVRALLEEMPKIESGVTGKYETRITIRTKQVLQTEPILEALDEGEVSVTTKKSRDTSWEIILSPRALLLSQGETFTNLAPPRYRLEIVSP